MSDKPTPRTDALLAKLGVSDARSGDAGALRDFARQLERELSLSEQRERGDDYVAWLRYVPNSEPTQIELCDSDMPGAFKVHRRPKLREPHLLSGSNEGPTEAPAAVELIAKLNDYAGDEQFVTKATASLLRQAAAALQSQVGLAVDVLAMCKQRGWSLHWTCRGAYLHLESSELIEAIRGKHGDPLKEAADVLLVLMSITEYADIPWGAVLMQARNKCDELMTKPPYPNEERASGSTDASVGSDAAQHSEK